MLLKHLLLQNGNSGSLAATVVSRSRIAAKNPNPRIGRQLRIDVTNRSEELRVEGIVPDLVGRLDYALPNLRQLSGRYVVASNVPVQGRLLGGGAEFYLDEPHLFREIGMPNQR